MFVCKKLKFHQDTSLPFCPIEYYFFFRVYIIVHFLKTIQTCFGIAIPCWYRQQMADCQITLKQIVMSTNALSGDVF